MSQSQPPPISSFPPPPQALPPPPPPPIPPQSPALSGGGGVQVRCAGCRAILTVGPGITEFACPTCRLPQMLPPELLQGPRTVAHGIDPTKIQLPCAQCKAILNVPHGLSRFNCPQCKVELAVDVSKLNYSSINHLAPPPPEDVNEV